MNSALVADKVIEKLQVPEHVPDSLDTSEAKRITPDQRTTLIN